MKGTGQGFAVQRKDMREKQKGEKTDGKKRIL